MPCWLAAEDELTEDTDRERSTLLEFVDWDGSETKLTIIEDFD